MLKPFRMLAILIYVCLSALLFLQVNNPKINFEERRVYSLVLECRDNGVGELAATYIVTVNVLDVVRS